VYCTDSDERSTEVLEGEVHQAQEHFENTAEGTRSSAEVELEVARDVADEQCLTDAAAEGELEDPADYGGGDAV
jgi:hypothetical protein